MVFRKYRLSAPALKVVDNIRSVMERKGIFFKAGLPLILVFGHF